MQKNKKINQKIVREIHLFFVRENYTKNRRENNEFIVKWCE